MATESGSLSPEDPAFKARIDELFSSALQDQAREQEEVVQTLHAAHAALTQSQNELAALRKLVESRDQAVVDLLEARLSGLSSQEGLDTLADRLEQLSGTASGFQSLERVMVQIAELISDMPESFGKAVARAEESIGGEIGKAVARAEESIGGEIGKAVARVEESIAGDIDTAQESITAAVERSRVEGMGEALAGLRESLMSSRERLEEAIAAASMDQIMASQAAAEGAALGISESLQAVRSVLQTDLTDIGSKLASNVDRFGESVDRLPGTLEGQLDKVTQTLALNAAELAGNVERNTSQVVEQLGTVATQMESNVASISEKFDSHLGRSNTQLDAHLEASGEQLHSYLETSAQRDDRRNALIVTSVDAVGQEILGQQQRIFDVIQDAISPFAEELQRLAERLKQSNRRITESNARVEAMHESLIGYMAQRDERLEEARDTMMKTMLEDLAYQLKTKERSRLADAVREAEQRRKDRRDAERFRRLRNASGGPSAEAIDEVRRILAAESKAPQRAASPTPELEPQEEPADDDAPDEWEAPTGKVRSLPWDEPESREEEEHDYVLLGGGEVEPEPERPRVSRKVKKPAPKKKTAVTARKPEPKPKAKAKAAPAASARKSKTASKPAAKKTKAKTTAKPRTSRTRNAQGR